MNKFLAGMVGAVAVMAMAAVAQTNVTGYVVSAYPTDGSAFARDGAMSSWWTSWSSNEQLTMEPTANGWVDGANTFSGPTDATFTVRCAYDAVALYMFFEITDNYWDAPAGLTNDNVDLLFDKISSQEIRDANPFDLYIQPSWNWTLTYYTVQYQVAVGVSGAVLPTGMGINYFSGSAMVYNNVNLTQLPTDYTGWDLDMKSVSANVRQMEWKVPWIWVGCGGGIGTMPPTNQLIAFAGGYNDSDSPTQTGRKGLRWKERDPFNACLDMVPSHAFCDSWGDIKITGSVNTKQPSNFSRKTLAKATSTQYFTVKGERLSGSQMNSLRRGTMVVERAVVNGQNVSKMIRTK